jgi:hypothetical protein
MKQSVNHLGAEPGDALPKVCVCGSDASVDAMPAAKLSLMDDSD